MSLILSWTMKTLAPDSKMAKCQDLTEEAQFELK